MTFLSRNRLYLQPRRFYTRRSPKPRPAPLLPLPIKRPTSDRDTKFRAIPTPNPYIWTMEGMDTEALMARSEIKAKAKAMFSAEPIYHDPASLNYSLPEPTDARHTEVAFLGRSNVGKSSLVGAILNNRQLVRTSKTPGCTQTLNLYSFKGFPLYLVDLPGYGYTRAPESAKNTWLEVVTNYLKGRGLDVLRRTFLLIDARHGVKRQDREVMSFFDIEGVSYQLVLTKVDTLRSIEERDRVINETLEIINRREHTACWPVLYLTSAKDKEQGGVKALRERLADIVYGH